MQLETLLINHPSYIMLQQRKAKNCKHLVSDCGSHVESYLSIWSYCFSADPYFMPISVLQNILFWLNSALENLIKFYFVFSKF